MIVLTGGTGFTGQHLLRDLGGTPVRLMVRKPDEFPAYLRRQNVEIVYGDFGDRPSMVRAFEGCDRLLNVGSLGFGHGPDVVAAAEEAGIQRAVFVSTTAIFTQLEASTKVIRLVAEERIRSSRLHWTILRPTMIYGTERDRNIFRLLKWLSHVPVFPVFGDGEHSHQPIHVCDLAHAIVEASRNDNTIGQVYNLAGKHPLTFNEVIRQAGEALGKRVAVLHIPQRSILPALELYNRISRRPLLKVEQVLRLNEDKAFPYDAATNDFGFESRSFADGVQEMVRLLKAKGLL